MRRLVSEARVARVATTDPDGRPNLVPFCFVLDGETLYSEVDEKPKTTPRVRRLDNVEARPERIAVIVDHYEEDWPKVWWVRLRGRGRVIWNTPEAQRAHELLREKYPQYREMSPLGEVLALDIGEWRGWAWTPIE
jgi:PPOX class probable F420-dependent enzyme